MYLNNLNQLINNSGMKRTYIAKTLNIKYDTFRRKLNGESDFKVSELITLCEILNINILEVFENGKES